jgi:hypothetical protein
LGQVGKGILKKILASVQNILLLAVCPFLLASGCKTDLAEPLQSGRVLAWHGLQGRWVGPVVPIQPSCGAETQGLMSIGENGFAFDPFRGTTVIRGKVADDGRINGDLVRQGPDHQDLSMVFEATARGPDEIAGTLQSGRCHWAVTLHRG